MTAEPTTDAQETEDPKPTDMIDAIALSLADATQTRETYHTQQDRVRWEASYFLSTLQARGYSVTEKGGET